MKKKPELITHMPPPDEIFILIRTHLKINPVPYDFKIDWKQIEKVKRIIKK